MSTLKIISIIFIPLYFCLVFAFRHWRQWLLYYLFGAFGFTIIVALFARAMGFDEQLVAVEVFHTNIVANLIGIPSQALFSNRLQLPTSGGYSILQIGIECSAVIEMAALVGLVAFYPAFTPLQKSGKILLGLVVTYIINILRMLIILAMGYYLGMQYIFLAHAVIGRLFFFVCVVALYWFILTKPTIAGIGTFLQKGNQAGLKTSIPAPARLSFRSNIFLILVSLFVVSLAVASYAKRNEWMGVWQKRIIPSEARAVFEAPENIISKRYSNESGNGDEVASEGGRVLGAKIESGLIPSSAFLENSEKNTWLCRANAEQSKDALGNKLTHYLWVNEKDGQKLLYSEKSSKEESKLQGKAGDKWNCYISASEEIIKRMMNE